MIGGDDTESARRRSDGDPRGDHAPRHALQGRRSARSRGDPAAHRLAARARQPRHLRGRLDGRADVDDGRRAHHRDARRGQGDRRPLPVPAGHRQRAHGRDARAHRRGRAPRRVRRARRDAVLRAAAAAGPVRLVLARRERVPRPAAARLQRADPRRGRHHAGDRRAPAPRAREHRRHQGDDQGLRARLLRPRRVRHRLHRALGHRAALLPDALPRRPRPPQLRRELRAEAGRRALRRVRSGRPRARAPAALRPPRARRRGLRRGQPGAREVGHGAPRADRVGPRARAARARSPTPTRTRVEGLLAGSPHVDLPAVAVGA